MENQCGIPPVRQTIANELLDKFSRIADRAHGLAQRTVDKLDPVMSPDNRLCENGENCPEQQYPPLFSEYRSRCYQIESALDIIEDAISRVEI